MLFSKVSTARSSCFSKSALNTLLAACNAVLVASINSVKSVTALANASAFSLSAFSKSVIA